MQRDRDVDCITVIRVMSVPISSPSLLRALFNSLHSCLNNLSTTSVFNPAPPTATNLATSAVDTQQLPGRIYLKVPGFMAVPLLHAGFGFGGVCVTEVWHDFRAAGFESRTPATKTLHSNFRAEEKKRLKWGKGNCCQDHVPEQPGQ